MTRLRTCYVTDMITQRSHIPITLLCFLEVKLEPTLDVTGGFSLLLPARYNMTCIQDVLLFSPG